jgi:hypothetical protein
MQVVDGVVGLARARVSLRHCFLSLLYGLLIVQLHLHLSHPIFRQLLKDRD